MPDDELRSSLELLYNVNRELASALDLHTVLQRVLFQSLKYAGGERGSIVVLDDNGKPVEAAIVIGKRILDHTTQQLREIVERGLAGWVLRQRQAALVSDTSQDERWLRRPDDAAERSGAKSAICVPLMARERPVGVLTLVHPTPGAYNDEHFSLMQAIADQAGIAVLNARLYAESQRQARVMTSLATSAATINLTLRLDEVLQRILSEIIKALQVETVAIALIEPEGSLVFKAANGKQSESVIGKSIPAGQGILGWVASEGQGVILPDVSADKRFLPGVDQFLRSTLRQAQGNAYSAGMEVKALSAAPIYAQGRVIGVLEAINPVSGTFDPDALLVLTGISSLAGSNIQHAQLFERLQSAHQRYRELFEDSIDPILLTNWDGKILEANHQAVNISGYAAQQLHEMSMGDLHLLNQTEKGADSESLKAGKTCAYESVLKSKAGQEIPIQVYVRKVVFEDSVSINSTTKELLQWILRDITERKHLDNLRDDLTAMIYHDLRSPLANIISSLDVLSTVLPPEDSEVAQSVMTIARRSTARIQRLISSLLDVNRLESGQPVSEKQSIAFSEILEEAFDAVRPITDNRRQSLFNDLAARLPPVFVDTDMIRRVLINLLENASKYTPQGGKIEMGAKPDGDWIQAWIQDNGPGIPVADQERIFDKFTRLKGKDSPSGLGVGLAFCRLAVQGHGGRIWVESTSGQGARFVFTLPVKKDK
ncbi:MAG: GAF domain-containing protein [Anaerolineales bacterium]|nr:GAF domain-containing protein [Anaerolineales bacterium]